MALARIFLMVGGRVPRVGPGAGVLSEPGKRSLLPQPFVIACAGLLSPAEQKKERGGGAGSLELELQIVLSGCVGSGN